MMRLLASLTLWMIAGAAVVAEPVAAEDAASETAAVRLALNWKAEPQFGGFYAAQAHGHYADGGVLLCGKRFLNSRCDCLRTLLWCRYHTYRLRENRAHLLRHGIGPRVRRREIGRAHV
jgi:hypothetical protein